MPLSDTRLLAVSKTLVDSPELPDELPIGRVIDERYRICGTIGRGGMGVVYEAQHLLIGRKVALKTIAAHAALSAAAIERFRREAQAAASVGSSHVVDVLDMGPLEGGSFYMVLEHLDGSDLAFAIAAGGPFPTDQALHVAGQLCDALSAVHEAGIVHRDLKPENVFLIARDGSPDFVKVLDFGVCKLIAPSGGTLTATGELVGTPQFMAPEQVEGGVSDHRTDIHALGAILFFLFTGRPPYQAPTLPKLFVSIANEPPPSVRVLQSELPDALDAVIRRALEKDPDRRFQSCRALKTALLGAFEQGDMSATLVEAAVKVDRAPENDSTAALSRGLSSLRARTVRTVGLVGAVGMALAMAFGWYFRSTATNTQTSIDSLRGEVEEAAPAAPTHVTVAPTAPVFASAQPLQRHEDPPRRRVAPSVRKDPGPPAPPRVVEPVAPSVVPTVTPTREPLPAPPVWQSSAAADSAREGRAASSGLNRGLKHGPTL